ncbi:DUF4141 domain-containing protein [Flavobacterium sp. UBA4197]|uniref:DUF4141 domain-containing protein n=1 Tax=Flavobacterium sp. UBA4197 TaxID=1946546 RepID=UPI00257B89D7|nr:DUF4141 domain-containing protein [Flavobacterium sp. UBA4197]
MKKLIYMVFVATVLATAPVKAQWVVSDPSNLAQGIVNTTRQIVQTSTTASNMIKNFNETVKIYEQGKQYYDALKSVHNLVKDARKVQNTILMVGDISDLYVQNFQKMLQDPNYSVEELVAIATGYAKLLEGGADMLLELRTVVNTNGLSLSDSERMGIIDRVYDRVKKQRDLVAYYTRKNISVSFLRAKKKGDLNRVIGLYGSASEKYW